MKEYKNYIVLPALLRFIKTWRVGRSGAGKNLLLVNSKYQKVFHPMLSVHEYSGSKYYRKNGDMQELKMTN